MKYRSPSPMSVDGALPTPPRSPRTSEHSRPGTNLLDHLQSFYQQEQYWVHHTRAALELAVVKGIDAPALATATGPIEAPSPASSCTSMDSAEPPSPQMSVRIKPDPDAEDQVDLELSLDARTSRWLRRKNQMRLKLDGIAHHRRRPTRAPPTEPGARLLEMFSELVEARMESCQRISRLVQRASERDDRFC